MTELVDDGARARIRLIPRLRVFTRDTSAGKKALRPPARLFNPEELRRLGEDVHEYRTQTGGDGYQYDGARRNPSGEILGHILPGSLGILSLDSPLPHSLVDASP